MIVFMSYGRQFGEILEDVKSLAARCGQLVEGVVAITTLTDEPAPAPGVTFVTYADPIRVPTDREIWFVLNGGTTRCQWAVFMAWHKAVQAGVKAVALDVQRDGVSLLA